MVISMVNLMPNVNAIAAKSIWEETKILWQLGYYLYRELLYSRQYVIGYYRECGFGR